MDAKLSELTATIRKFIEERDWDQFHNAKDMAISLNLEASEVLEHFQWKSKDKVNKEELGKELSDVLYWILVMSYNLDINLGEVFNEKMRENAKKYPVSKARGSSKKYTEL